MRLSYNAPVSIISRINIYETFIDPEYGNMAIISKISNQTKLIAVNYEIKDDSPNILYTGKYIILPTEGKFFERKKIGPNPEIK